MDIENYLVLKVERKVLFTHFKVKKKLLLTDRKWYTDSANSNPIGVFDLASYARSYGYLVDVYYIDELSFTNKYDLIGLSVFQGENRTIFNDVVFLKQVFLIQR